jgi:hypothetical protein
VHAFQSYDLVTHKIGGHHILIAALANKLKGKVSAFVRKKPLECSVIVSIFV